MRIRKLLTMLSSILFVGCSVHPNMNPTPEFAPIQPIP